METATEIGMETEMEFQLLDLSDLSDLFEQVQKLRQYLLQAMPKVLRVLSSDLENVPG